jgi:predicted ester cyclase
MKRLLAILSSVCFIAISCTNSSGPASAKDSLTAAGSSMSPSAGSSNDMLEKNRATALASVQGFINHDATATLKDVSSDFVDYGDGSSAPIKGMDSCKASIQSFLTAFPDVKGENLMAIAEGDHVAVFGDWSGTFKMKMMNMEPTGKSFKMKDCDLFTFNNNGQITEHHAIQPMGTIMMQVMADKKK